MIACAKKEMIAKRNVRYKKNMKGVKQIGTWYSDWQNPKVYIFIS